MLSLINKQLKLIVAFIFAAGLIACADSSPLQVAQGLFGYVPPPEETTIAEELQSEYDRCMKIGGEDNCAQVAYDMVRTVKGLEPRTVPKGVVIILRGDGGHADPTENTEQNNDQSQTPEIDQ